MPIISSVSPSSTSNLADSSDPTAAGAAAAGPVGAVDPKAAEAALVKKLAQAKQEGNTAEATKILNELNTLKDQAQTGALLQVGFTPQTDTLAPGEVVVPPNLLSSETTENEAPTDGTSNWSSDFESLLDCLPAASGAQGTAGTKFGLEDVAGRALPAMFLSGASGSALTGASLVDVPGVTNLSADENVRSEQTNRIETFKSYERVTQTFWSKMGSDEASAGGSSLAAGLPAHTLQPLKVAQAKIADAYKSYMALPAGKSTAGTGATAAASTAAAGDLVPEIPGPQITQMEQACKTVVGLGSAISNQIAANAGLGLAASKQVFGIVTPNGEVPTDGGSTTNPLDPTATPDTTGTSTVMSAGVDIDSLLIVVMMQATNVEDDMLDDQLTEMEQMTDQKKQMRAVDDQMKQAEASLQGQMQTEFAQGQSTGAISNTITFDQYSAWRQCQYANVNDQMNTDGSHSISWAQPQLEEPCPPIPDWMHTGTAPPTTTTTTSDTDSSGDVNLTTAYGLPPQAEGMLQQIYNSMDPTTKASYASFSDFIASIGFVPANSIQDIQNNLQALSSVVGDSQAAADQNNGAQNPQYISDLATYNTGLKTFQNTPADQVDVTAADFQDPTFKASLDNALEVESAWKAGQGEEGGGGYDDPGRASTTATPAATVQVPILDYTKTPPTATGQYNTVALNDFLASKVDPAVGNLMTQEIGNVQAQVQNQMQLLRAVTEELANGNPSVGDVQNAIQKMLKKYAPSQYSALVNAGAFSNNDGDYAAIGAVVGGILGNVFGAGFGAAIGGAWNSLFGGGSTSSNVDSGSIQFNSDGLHFNVDNTQHNAWPESDQHSTTPNTIDFTTDANGNPIDPPSYLGLLQQQQDSTDGPKGQDLVKFVQGVQKTPPMPSPNFTLVQPFSGTLPDPTDPKYSAGLSDTQFTNAQTTITTWETELNDPNSLIRRLAKENQLDGSAPPPAAADIAAAAAQNAAIPTNAQGQILGNTGTLASLTAYQGTIDDNLQNLGDMSDIMQMKLQASMDRRSKFIEALSNLLKKISDTEDAVVQNLK